MRCSVRLRETFALWVCMGVVWTAVDVRAAGPLFQGLGHLEGGSFPSEARGVSADGSVIVGYSGSSSGSEAFRWTLGDGMVGLGTVPGGSMSIASAVSANGAVVVGYGETEDFSLEGFRWTAAGGMVLMPDFNEWQENSIANAVSADGSVIVGQAIGPAGNHAFRWTAAGGMSSLGNIVTGQPISSANATTRDGSVVVGRGQSDSGWEAFRWSPGTGMKGLGDLAGGKAESGAYGISGDGRVIVGYGYDADGQVPVRWVDEVGLEALGVGLDALGGEARGVSGDGRVIVGKTKALGAFIWDEDHGLRGLSAVLADTYGLGDALAGWQLDAAYGISEDGKTIVGMGRNPMGEIEAWRAVVPEVSGLWPMLGSLGVLFGRRVGRKRSK